MGMLGAETPASDACGTCKEHALVKRTIAIVLTLLAGSGGSFWALHSRMGETRAEMKEALAQIATRQLRVLSDVHDVSDKVDGLTDRMARVETRVDDHANSEKPARR